MIKKEGEGYTIYSESGDKKLGSYPNKGAAARRLAQIEYFKAKDEKQRN